MPTHLGEFEQLVLLALIRLGEDGYGVAVRDEIRQRTGRDTDFGTVYSTLARLEDKGLVTSRLGDPTPERGGRRKKHFTTSPAGRSALDRALQALRTMTRGLGPRLQLP
jgi:DNA-binding PadR family transcriptional regulator